MQLPARGLAPLGGRARVLKQGAERGRGHPAELGSGGERVDSVRVVCSVAEQNPQSQRVTRCSFADRLNSYSRGRIRCS